MAATLSRCRSRLPHRNLTLDIVRFESDRLSRTRTRQYCDVVELLDRVLEAQPLDGVAGVNVDNQHATPCDSVLFGQAFVEREPGKGLAMARSRQSDDSVAANEGETPRITGAKADRCERAAGRIDGAEFAGAGIQQPKLSVVESRRVRHGKAAGHNLAAPHIDHDAAVVAPVAPAVGNIRAAHCSDKRGTGAVHCESVKVAPILRRQRGRNFRPPKRPKLAASLIVARQPYSVLTKIGRRAPSTSPTPMSWMSIRPTTRPSRGTNLRSAPVGVVSPLRNTFSKRHSM